TCSGLPHLEALRARRPCTRQLGCAGRGRRRWRHATSGLGAYRPHGGRARALRLVRLRLPRCAVADPGHGGHLPVPDGRPRPASDVELRACHAPRGCCAPDVSGRIERRITGRRRRPGSRARARAAAVDRGGSGELRCAAAPRDRESGRGEPPPPPPPPPPAPPAPPPPPPPPP